MSEFLRRLRALARRPVRTPEELANWQASADELLAWVRTPPAQVADALPHFVWHYLSDADARLRDAKYREAQEKELEAVLRPLTKRAR
jgi:hypothetical protein